MAMGGFTKRNDEFGGSTVEIWCLRHGADEFNGLTRGSTRHSGDNSGMAAGSR